MATYQIRGLPVGLIPDFKRRCVEGGVDPDELLRAVIEHTRPEPNDDGEPTVAHRFTFHQFVRKAIH